MNQMLSNSIFVFFAIYFVFLHVFFSIFFIILNIKIVENNIKKYLPGAPNYKSGIIIDIILHLWSKEYQICCAGGVEEA